MAAVTVCTAVRLDAAVLDDFEHGVQFAEGGGETNYFVWGLTNGQLVVYTNTPIPTPHGDVLITYDSVYWPSPRPPVGNLDGGRTLEVRMDLEHASADDLFAQLGVGGSTANQDSGYAAFVDRNEVGLMKYGYQGITTFYWDTLATTNENVTVRLAFTKTNNFLAITVKVVDKGNQRATLYERTFVDGPGRDGPVPPPDPHGYGFFTPDLGRPYTNFTYFAAGCSQVIFTTPPPLELRLDNLEYDVYDAPEIAIERNLVCLSWSEDTIEDQVVVTADSLTNSVWTPLPEPVFKRNGRLCVIVETTGEEQYFKLVPGTQFVDDFDGSMEPWRSVFSNPSDATHWLITNVNNALRIQTLSPLARDEWILQIPGSDIVFGDFSASVDIVDWDTNVLGQIVSICARGWLDPTNLGSTHGQCAGLILNEPVKGKCKPFFWVSDTGVITGGPEIVLKPGARYRLCFSAVGSKLSLRLYNVDNLNSPIAQVQMTHTTWSQGFVALHGRKWSDSYAVTLDNFFVSGTKP